jgi:hypothetical protein
LSIVGFSEKVMVMKIGVRSSGLRAFPSKRHF